jgi:hypothetical protein
MEQEASATGTITSSDSNDFSLRCIDEFKKLLQFFNSGVFYRSKRAFVKIR